MKPWKTPSRQWMEVRMKECSQRKAKSFCSAMREAMCGRNLLLMTLLSGVLISSHFSDLHVDPTAGPHLAAVAQPVSPRTMTTTVTVTLTSTQPVTVTHTVTRRIPAAPVELVAFLLVAMVLLATAAAYLYTKRRQPQRR